MGLRSPLIASPFQRERRGVPDIVYVVLPGVPNGTLRQDYWRPALVADSQEVVDVNMPKVVALSQPF